MYNLMKIDDAFKKALDAYTRYDVMSTNKLCAARCCNEIKKVIFHDPATIVYWNDGTKTVVKSHGERFDPEKGLAIINMSGEASIVGTSRRFNVPAEDIPITNDAVIEPVRCNILPARPSGGVSGTYALDAPGISLQNNQSVSQPNINIRVPGCKTLEEIKAWLTDNPLTVYYQSTSYNGANGLDICLTEYQNGSIELDGTESNLQFFSEYQTLAIKGITTAGDPSQANAYGVCISSHFALVPPGTSTTLDKVVYGQPQYNQIIIHDTSWNSLETAKAYLAAQKAAS